MPFYTGKSADGSDAIEFPGMYVSSCGNYWSSAPWTEQSEKEVRKQERSRAWKEKIKQFRKGRK